MAVCDDQRFRRIQCFKHRLMGPGPVAFFRGIENGRLKSADGL